MGGTQWATPMGLPDVHHLRGDPSGGYPMYIRGKGAVHQGGGYPMYIREWGYRCTLFPQNRDSRVNTLR